MAMAVRAAAHTVPFRIVAVAVVVVALVCSRAS